jgi:methenyltetrahydromethanopterin cyclohydrolase
MKQPSVNKQSAALIEFLLDDEARLRLKTERLDSGCVLVDAGIAAPGGLEAGRRIAEICLGGLGRVSLAGTGPVAGWPSWVTVHTEDPVIACLGSQYAGWSLTHGEGEGAYQALGSGPARALACNETLFAELGYEDVADRTCLVLEVDEAPPLALIEKIARDCHVEPAGLVLILTPTRSLAGTVQIVSRVLEVAMHKAHVLGFNLSRIEDGIGTAPLPPPAPDFITAMGRTNDAILFAGQVQLFVRGDDTAAEYLARRLPSSASRDYGQPFGEVFKAYDHDFFQIDPMLFSPARVTVTALDSGRSFSAGKLDTALLETSFGIRP